MPRVDVIFNLLADLYGKSEQDKTSLPTKISSHLVYTLNKYPKNKCITIKN